MKYRAVFFDVDGTITAHPNSWRCVHEELGIWHGAACLHQQRFAAGEISYKRFCELDAAEWRGLSEEIIAGILRGVPYSANAGECLLEMKRMGLLLAAISTGLQYIPERLIEEFGFIRAVSNTLESREGLITGGVTINVSHGEKGKVFEKILAEAGLSPEEAVCVGDSEGDIPLLDRAGYSIAFNSSSRELSAAADCDCRTGDFREVLEAVIAASG